MSAATRRNITSVTTQAFPAAFETLNVRQEGGVLLAEIAAPPMNLLGPELVRDLVSLIQRAEADDAVPRRAPESSKAPPAIRAQGVPRPDSTPLQHQDGN